MLQLTMDENQARCDFFKHFQYSTKDKLGTVRLKHILRTSLLIYLILCSILIANLTMLMWFSSKNYLVGYRYHEFLSSRAVFDCFQSFLDRDAAQMSICAHHCRKTFNSWLSSQLTWVPTVVRHRIGNWSSKFVIRLTSIKLKLQQTKVPF